jgi:hypothetical protein
VPSGAYLVCHATTPKYGFDLWAVSLAERKVVFLKKPYPTSCMTRSRGIPDAARRVELGVKKSEVQGLWS